MGNERVCLNSKCAIALSVAWLILIRWVRRIVSSNNNCVSQVRCGFIHVWQVNKAACGLNVFAFHTHYCVENWWLIKSSMNGIVCTSILVIVQSNFCLRKIMPINFFALNFCCRIKFVVLLKFVIDWEPKVKN